MKKQKKSKPIEAIENQDYLRSRNGRLVRIMAEFSFPRTVFAEAGIQDTIVFFGSARLQPPEKAKANLNALKKQKKVDPKALKAAQYMVELSHYYTACVELSKRCSEWSKKNSKTFAICSGGGPGIMEAANKGAKLAGCPSIGLNIQLPFEQHPNPYISDELNLNFHYFFLRKFWFLYLAKAIIIFPGGFGTLDEMMEVLTLIQTHKVEKDVAIVLFDRKFWNKVINFDFLVEAGMISPEDLKLFKFCDTVDEAYEFLHVRLEKQIKQSKTRKAISFIRPVINI